MNRQNSTGSKKSRRRSRRGIEPWRLNEKINPQKLGKPPGTPIYVGEKEEFTPFISALRYSAANLTEWVLVNPTEADRLLAADPKHPEDVSPVLWIDVEGVHDVSLVQHLSRILGLHALTSEDIVNTHLRPQFESYDSYFFFALKMIYLSPEDSSKPDSHRELIAEHVSLVLRSSDDPGVDWLCTFQEKPGDIFGRIRDRIRTKTGKLRARGADHLLYTLLDAVVDGYLQVVDHLADQIELLEEEMRTGPRDSHLTRIYRLKREILWLRKTIFPVRDLLSKVQVDESVFQDNTKIYLRDLSDHVAQVTDSLTLSMEMVSVLVDTWHSLNNQKMNAIMKTLTMISTIFLPLNFIAGVYGMNFQHMPELSYRFGYPIVLLVMITVAISIVAFFVARGWLWERPERPSEAADNVASEN